MQVHERPKHTEMQTGTAPHSEGSNTGRDHGGENTHTKQQKKENKAKARNKTNKKNNKE